jgi:hypothetical protein
VVGTADGGNPVGHFDAGAAGADWEDGGAEYPDSGKDGGATGIEDEDGFSPGRFEGGAAGIDDDSAPDRRDWGMAGGAEGTPAWNEGTDWLAGVGARGGNLDVLGGAGGSGSALEIAFSSAVATTLSCEARSQRPPSTAESAPRRNHAIASWRAPRFH